MEYGSHNWSTRIAGVLPEYFAIREISAAEGVLFTDEDLRKISKVCLIGKTVRTYLFPDGTSPVGKTIRVGDIPFKVIGVLNEKGQSGVGTDQDLVVEAL